MSRKRRGFRLGGGPAGVAALFALTLVAAGCGMQARGSLSRPKSHVVVIVMENKEYGDVIGKASAPYVNGLARRYALATNFYAVSHPSLPNYLALTGGDTFGTRTDCIACHFAVNNLADELESAGMSWKAYVERMRPHCSRRVIAGESADPFVYYDSVANVARRCSMIVPYRELAGDMRRGRLPTFVWIAPNRCHNTHDCGVGTGDRYLARLVPSLLRDLGPHGVLYLTWDEGRSNRGCCGLAAGGHVATIVAGPDVRRGDRSSTPYDDYSILRTISDSLHLAPLREAACSCTTPLDALFSHRPAL